MSAIKKLRKKFNSIATKTSTTVMATVLSLGLGVGAAVGIHESPETRTPEAVTQQYDVAAEKARALGAEIIAEKERISFNDNLIFHATRNIGNNDGSLSQQAADLQALRNQRIQDEAAQDARALALAKTLFLNPAISEADAVDVYKNIYEKAYDEWDRKEYNETLGWLMKGLPLRDEIVADMKLPKDPAAVSDETMRQALERAATAESRNDIQAAFGTLGATFGSGALAFALIAMGYRGRRREQEEAEKQAWEKQRKTRPPKPEPEPTATPVVARKEETPVPVKQTPPGKFSL